MFARLVKISLVVVLISFGVSTFAFRKAARAATLPTINTVFLIVMENHNWSDIAGSASAPYINNTLLPAASYATQYMNPAGNHPSLPNYLWLEAGTNFGIANDKDPSANHQSTTQHLTSLLTQGGISWKSYQEDIDGTSCPLTKTGLYAPKHNPMVYFDDVTNGNDPNSASCISHVRPYTELASDLQNNATAAYNFITPNLCDDMHDSRGCATSDSVSNGDTWLSTEVPQILNSQAYQNGGALFITWDEGEGAGGQNDGPIGLIVMSPLAAGNGYSNAVAYTHSSLLLTLEEIFGTSSYLGDSANATDLSDLFTPSTAPQASAASSAPGIIVVTPFDSTSNMTPGVAPTQTVPTRNFDG